jgi:uroporphyrinogen-III synthase
MPDKALMGVNVLVTRPISQAQELARSIEARGGNAVFFPVIEIMPRDAADIAADAASLQEPDLVVFVSRNAVQYGLPYVANGQIAAVGPATAAALEDAGCEVDIRPVAGFDSEHLLAEPDLIEVAGKVVRIIRGNGGRELLADTLRERGAQVEYLPVYARTTPAYSDTQLADLESRWRASGIDVVTLMSAESVRNFDTLLPTWCREQLHRSSLVAPAARVLKVALDTFPGTSATLAAGPQTSDMINAIVALGQTEPGHSS